MLVQPPTHRRHTRRAGRRKPEVLDAAVRVITNRGVEATRFTDVSEASGVPVASLQYYFGTRDDLLLAAFRHGSDTALTALRAKLQSVLTPWEKLLYIIESQLRSPDAHAPRAGLLYVEFFRAALRDPDLRAGLLADYTGWRKAIEDAVRAGRDNGDFAPDIDPEQVALQLLAVVDGIAQPMALGDSMISPDMARNIVIDTLTAILGASPPPGAVEAMATLGHVDARPRAAGDVVAEAGLPGNRA